MLLSALDKTFEVDVAPPTDEWLDYETSHFIENELYQAADFRREWLSDVCGLEQFDVGAEVRSWWHEEVRAFRVELLRKRRNEEKLTPCSDGWHEDFELESRRQLAFLSYDVEFLL